MANSKIESKIQQNIIRLWQFKYSNSRPELSKCLFSVPNEGLRTQANSKRMKAEGMVAGISDLILLYRGHAHFIEIKTEKGRLSPHQKMFQKQVEGQGFNYHIIRSVEEFQTIADTIIR